MADKILVGGVFFPDFELLDIFGPLELFGMLPEHAEIITLGHATGPVASAQGPRTVIDESLADIAKVDVLLVPGGRGTRALVDDHEFLSHLVRLHENAQFTASICTGSMLLARAGLLQHRRATTNKLVFDFSASFGPETTWLKRARWVKDGNIYTASGVSAGMDMTLALITDLFDRSIAEQAARYAEYVWNDNPDNDPFAVA